MITHLSKQQKQILKMVKYREGMARKMIFQELYPGVRCGQVGKRECRDIEQYCTKQDAAEILAERKEDNRKYQSCYASFSRSVNTLVRKGLLIVKREKVKVAHNLRQERSGYGEVRNFDRIYTTRKLSAELKAQADRRVQTWYRLGGWR